MKKKYICLLMVIALVMCMSFNAFAVDIAVDVGDVGGIPSDEFMIELYTTYVPGASYEYYSWIGDASYSGRKNCAFISFYGSNTCVYKGAKFNDSLYYGALCTLNADGTYSTKSYGVRRYGYLPDDGGTFEYTDDTQMYVTDDNKVFVGGSGDYIKSNVPVASSLENAKAYLETGDAAYLDNGVLFEDVERPINVALYKASEEGNYYLYWENDGATEEAKKKYTTFIRYELKYQDAGGNSKYIKDPYTLDYPFESRSQVAMDYSDLLLYDSSYVNMYLYNGRNLGTDEVPNWVYSDEVCIEIPLYHSDSYYITLYDEEGTPTKTNEFVLNDYGTQNESFTGGTPVDISSSIPSAGSGDYGFFNYLITGFGLLGDNGLLALVGKLFSFLPAELFARIEYGIYGLVAVGIFKLFIKA